MSKKEELVKAVLEKAQHSQGKSRLTCAEAFAIAEEFSSQIKEIGQICNQQDVKICNCQLGCFK